METKVINGQVWLDVTEKSRDLYDILPMYAIDQHGVERAIETYTDLLDALKVENKICIEVGSANELYGIAMFATLKKMEKSQFVPEPYAHSSYSIPGSIDKTYTIGYDSYVGTSVDGNQNHHSLVDKLRPYSRRYNIQQARGITITNPF